MNTSNNLTENSGKILVVDDEVINLTLLSSKLKREGYAVTKAQNGKQALEILQREPFDLVLLDILMPEMDGFQVLEQMKSDATLRHIPVIVISALEKMEDVVRCIERGALDHLTKPFNPLLLKARIDAALAAKRLHDKEQELLKIIQIEKQKVEDLLLNILPAPIAKRLEQGEEIIADHFDDVTVLFADIVGFTTLSARMEAAEVVVRLNEIFSIFDELAKEHGLEKIKTIGDAYMLVGGLPRPCQDHAEAIADMALDMQKGITHFNVARGESFQIRIGIHTGPVVAGVIGTSKFIYDLWGDTVNMASRMESHGTPGSIQVTATTYERLREKYAFEERGTIQVKGKGEMDTYLLLGRKTG